MKQSCRTCRNYDLANVKSPTGRVMSDRVAECLFVVPLMSLPDSITTNYRFAINFTRRFMSPTNGTSCPCWSELKEEK